MEIEWSSEDWVGITRFGYKVMISKVEWAKAFNDLLSEHAKLAGQKLVLQEIEENVAITLWVAEAFPKEGRIIQWPK